MNRKHTGICLLTVTDLKAASGVVPHLIHSRLAAAAKIGLFLVFVQECQSTCPDSVPEPLADMLSLSAGSN